MAGRRTGHLSVRLRRAPTRYRPLERLAAGGMAEVWRGEAIFEAGDSFPVAIKRVLPHLASNPLYRSMFEDEARLGMLLRHPNIVRVYDAREVAGTYLMIMELVDGTSLKDLLDGAHARGACMPVATALHITRELARALDYAHDAKGPKGEPLGIVHRDVSPHNILLGKTGALKLTDFGLADAQVHQTIRSEDLVGGKIGYLAPEVILQKPADGRIDVFAAGIILWECLCGRRLFRGHDDSETLRNVVRKPVPPPSEIAPNVPPEVDELVLQVLDRNPEARIRTAGDLAERLDRILTRIDPKVGARDLALVVGLHLAKVGPKLERLDGLALLAQELEAFAQGGADMTLDMGAAPLDPADFGRPVGSGVRERPSDPGGAEDPQRKRR